MGRREWAWTAGTAATLLLAAWVSGAGPIAAFTTPVLSPPTDEEFGELVEPDTGDARNPTGERSRTIEDNELVANVVAWTLRVLLVVIVAVVVALVVRAVLRRLRRDPVTPKDDVEAPVLPDVLLAGVRESEAQLDRGSSSEAVINAWLALERTAVEVGIDDDLTRTPTELVAAVLEGYDVDRAAISRLAALYREARFSTHPIGETHRSAAREALRTVRDELTRPLLAMGGIPAGPARPGGTGKLGTLRELRELGRSGEPTAMRQHLATLVRGHEIATGVAVAAVLGLVVSVLPALDRPLLLVASTGLLLVVAALAIWLFRSHREVEWTTSAGAPERVRGSDRRVTSLSRTIDAALAGDEGARADVRALVRSAAEARLTSQGLSTTLDHEPTRAALGPGLTAYLTSATPRPVTTDELASFITTLEEN